MKAIKSCMGALFVAGFLMAGLGTQVFGSSEKESPENANLLAATAEIKKLQEAVKKLEDVVETQKSIISKLRKELDEKAEENRRLTALCESVGMQTTLPVETEFGPDDIVYRGKKRSAKWFDRMYEMFHNKFICLNGKYIYIGKVLLGDTYTGVGGVTVYREWSDSIPNANIAQLRDAKVISALGKRAMLAYKNGEVTHIHGLAGTFVDGENISTGDCVLLPTGTYEYTSTTGAQKTVSSYLVQYPLTKEEFTQMLKSGVELVGHEKVLKDRRGRIIDRNRFTVGIDLNGKLTIRDRRGRIVRELHKGEHYYEVIGKRVP
ncbi:MAG: hypothetical protein ACYS21_04535 [Planctomycetota bacterium]|jgi:hypothetical protein